MNNLDTDSSDIDSQLSYSSMFTLQKLINTSWFAGIFQDQRKLDSQGPLWNHALCKNMFWEAGV